MSIAKITLFSFARWMQLNNDDLFANLSLPTGIQKDVLVDNILLRGGEFEVVYSDPNFMQYAIGSWSRKWYRTMEKWIAALSIEYAPLENYDRFEHWQDLTDRDTASAGGSGSENVRTHADTDTTTNANTDTRIHDNVDQRLNDNTDKTIHADTDTRTHADTDTQTNNNTDQRTHDYVDSTDIDSNIHDDIDEDDTRETQVSAFDSSNYQPSQKETLKHGGDNTRTENTSNIASHAGTITDEHTGTITNAHTGTITDAHTGNITDEHTGTITDAHAGTITDEHTGTITDAHTGTITDGFDETHSDNGSENTDFVHDGRIHGNIGVTTSQQMLQSELDIAEWNIYEHITDLFLTEFVIPIYT